VDLVSLAVDHLVNNAGIGGKSVRVENLRHVSDCAAVMVSHEMLTY